MVSVLCFFNKIKENYAGDSPQRRYIVYEFGAFEGEVEHHPMYRVRGVSFLLLFVVNYFFIS